jgi:hypothetical protein
MAGEGETFGGHGDVEEAVPWILGSVLAVVTGAGTLMASVALARDEVTGTNMVEDVLCRAFGGQTCHAVANLTLDEARQVQLVLQGCEGSTVARCFEDGLERFGVAPEHAVEWFADECDQGRVWACIYLGNFLRDGTGVAVDAERAAALYRQACDVGHAFGCTNLGLLYEAGTGVEADAAQAAALYRRGCDGGEATGCTNLGFLYRTGAGVEADAAQAAALYRQGCDGGHAPGCTNLGSLYRTGTGVGADAAQAAALYRQGCDGGDAGGLHQPRVSLWRWDGR